MRLAEHENEIISLPGAPEAPSPASHRRVVAYVLLVEDSIAAEQETMIPGTVIYTI